MKRCPKCNSPMPDDVTLCIRCGFATAFLSATLGGLAVAFIGAMLMLASVILAALVGSALYLYATGAKLPESFAGARLQEAFVSK
jgi:hypothetical protein